MLCLARANKLFCFTPSRQHHNRIATRIGHRHTRSHVPSPAASSAGFRRCRPTRVTHFPVIPQGYDQCFVHSCSAAQADGLAKARCSATSLNYSYNGGSVGGFLDDWVLQCCERDAGPLSIAVLLSGGVDSSVALRLLHAAGHKCTAYYLKIWFQEDFDNFWGSCPWEDDLAVAEQVCAQIGVELRVVHLTDEYWQRVVAHCISEIKSGRTPNPDILCNSRVKFGAFFDHIDFSSFDRVASGHYARVQRSPSPSLPPSPSPSSANSTFASHHSHHPAAQLCLSADEVKDQTYFLSGLSQHQLSHTLFPLGPLSKAQVRELALRFDLPNSGRKDSQGICFLGKVRFSEFVSRHVGEREGALIDSDTGVLLGRHRGVWFFTVGQRQGIKLSGGPWYVVAKDPPSNAVFVSREYHSARKTRRQFWAGHFSFLSPLSPADLHTLPGLRCKVRHGPNFYSCKVTPVHGAAAANAPQVEMPPREEPMGNTATVQESNVRGQVDNPESPSPSSGGLSDCPWSTVADAALVSIGEDDQGLAAGQYAAFYDGPVCLGCAVILGVPADDERENVSPAAWAALAMKELPKKVQPPKERKQTLVDNEEKKALRNIAQLMS